MKTTPVVWPVVALPTVMIPADDNAIPVGSGAPFAETPKVPPFPTVLGSVGARSKLCAVPATNVGTLGFHAVAPGPGAGGGELPDVDWLPPPQPTRSVAELNSASFSVLRREFFGIKAIRHKGAARE